MKRSLILSAVFIAVFEFCAGPDCFGATYKYIDKNGQVGFADDLQAVPEPCRSTAVLISGEAKEGGVARETPGTPGAPAPAPAPSAPLLVQAPAHQTQAQPQAGMPFSIRLAISIAVVIATIVLSVFLSNVGALHGQIRTIHILRVALSWLVVTYLVAAHAKDIWTIFKMAGRQVQSVSDESAKKGEKAAKAIKALDAAMERAALQVQEHDKAVKEAEQATE